MKTLFNGKMEYDSDKELKAFFDKMSRGEAANILEMGLNHGLSNGTFDLTEAAILYNALRVLKEEQTGDPIF